MIKLFIININITAAGWTICAFGILQIPFWMMYTIISKKNLQVSEVEIM